MGSAAGCGAGQAWSAAGHRFGLLEACEEGAQMLGQGLDRLEGRHPGKLTTVRALADLLADRAAHLAVPVFVALGCHHVARSDSDGKLARRHDGSASWPALQEDARNRVKFELNAARRQVGEIYFRMRLTSWAV